MNCPFCAEPVNTLMASYFVVEDSEGHQSPAHSSCVRERGLVPEKEDE